MERFLIKGGHKLKGEVTVSGAKNVAMKVVLAGLLTDKTIVVRNIPNISSVLGTIDIVKPLGVKADVDENHTMTIRGDGIKSYTVPFELGGLYRTATMVIGPLLARFGKARVPNPGGCRIGRRPIDRHIEGLKSMGAVITYEDGYFYARTDGLHGTNYTFRQNTHTGTETLILAAVLANGETILENAAQEPEIDDLIKLLNLMGARIRRRKRTIIISGVKCLSGAEFEIMPDRNEVVTFALATIASGGDVIVRGTQREYLKSFLQKLDDAGAGWEPISSNKTRFYFTKRLLPTNVQTDVYPGFMTDWQAPWVILMTQANGISQVHETIYEDRFGYVEQLQKMGAKIEFFSPNVKNPLNTYNFNWSDRGKGSCHAVRIYGPQKLHNALLEVTDLRAGASLLISSIIAQGESVVEGIEHIDRGYERIEQKLKKLGADIVRIND
ncbi:MAG: UDP-N-acetylglucosamine 1-carboxyvinyltransferase [Patescibacteria group bacterium]|nr:UDP-N-acetylglucosamine 1-carboxyvinyltransferase [Patescibacteria group bacterium]